MLLMRRGGRAPHLIASSAAADSDLFSLVHPRDTYPSTWSAANLDREALRSRTARTQLSGISSRSMIVGKSWESQLHSASARPYLLNPAGDRRSSALRYFTNRHPRHHPPPSPPSPIPPPSDDPPTYPHPASPINQAAQRKSTPLAMRSMPPAAGRTSR